MCLLFVLEVFQGQWICGSHHGQSLLRSKAGAFSIASHPKKRWMEVAWNCEMLWHVFLYQCFLFSFIMRCISIFRSHTKFSGCCCFWPTSQVMCADMKNTWHRTCFLMTLQIRVVSLSTVFLAHCPWFAGQGSCYPGAAILNDEIFMRVLSSLHGILG